jgi:hypothetical protein
VRVGRWGELSVLAALGLTAIALWPATVAQFWNVPGRDIPWEVALRTIADGEYERLGTPNRDAVAAFDARAAPGALAVGDPHERAWLTEGRGLTPFWELEFRLRATEPLPDTPAETLRRVRAAGVSWVLATPDMGGYDYFQQMVKRYGQPVWTNGSATLYRLPYSAP